MPFESTQHIPRTIAVASGKGGTGKTTVSANLAMSLANAGEKVIYADCDVEAPNGSLFLNPEISNSRPSVMSYPVVDEERCTGCGACQKICRFNAIIVLDNTPMVFSELCHDCGGCVHVCPVGAITEQDRVIGKVETGNAGPLGFIQGRLDIGQVMSPPLIRDVKRSLPDTGTAIIDCPPGTSCPVMTAIAGTDYVLLVTEPTPFGLHDLKAAVEAVQLLGIPAGAVINRFDLGASDTEKFLAGQGIPIVMRIPDDMDIARAYSSGALIIDALPQYGELFNKLCNNIVSSFRTTQSTRKDAP